MQKKALVIGDIEKQLNTSINTVSFILNGKAEQKRISTKLTQKVLKLVDELGYVPNHLAKSLRTGKTNIIGLIVEDISNPFFVNVARQIEEEANKKGYKIFYCSSESEPGKTKELIKVFRERQVDGYIITPSNGIEDEILSLQKSKCHLILLDRYLPGVNTNYVVVDNVGGAYNAVKHLIEEGYKNIGFVTVVSKLSQMQGRMDGYKKALDGNSKRPFIKRLKYNEDPEKMVQQIVSFLKEKPEIDAIFFATNYLGISGLEALKRLNYKIPSDLGVVSFDDHDLFRLYTPSVTVVAQPVEEMSKRIINILLDELHAKDSAFKPKQFVLPTELIVRQSSAQKQAASLSTN